MSVLENLLSSLTGASSQSAEHPCSNCPSDCPIAGDACPACQPYKEKLIEALYNVEHAQELRARYVVSPTGAPTGTVTCPYCGAPSANRVTCEFCGMQIGQDDGKIYVSSAAEIPNPILEAQDIIYGRYAAVGGSYRQKVGYLSQIGVQKSGGFLSGLLELLSGGDSEGLGNKMTEAEILEAAGLYGVTAAQYLSGLDNGVYLPLLEKKKADRQSAHSAFQAGAGTAAGLGLGHSAQRRPPARPRPPEPPRPANMQARRPPEPPRRADRDPGAARTGRQPDEIRFTAPPQAAGKRKTLPELPERRGKNERSAPGQKQGRPGAAPQGNRPGGGGGRRPEGPAQKPGDHRGGGHQR